MKKKTSQISSKPRARKKHGAKLMQPKEKFKGYICVGFDTSPSSLAGAAFGYDAILGKVVGPAFVMRHFTRDDDYFSRLLLAANAHEMMQDLLGDLGVLIEMKDIWIAQEEPFPAHGGFTKRGIGQSMKQQAEISGAFLGGLIRWGYTNIIQVSNQHWRSNIARAISEATGEDVTTYPAKWKDERLAARFNCKPNDTGKFRAQQWAQDVFEPWFAQQGGVEIPDFPPMITRDGVKISRPDDSKAKAFQPDDRFDALAVADWMYHERRSLLGITGMYDQ